ncbi:MAG: 50S ribosomal protein L13 [Bacteroidales bacterium]|nr:50S ribosomal protein L13 [Bacteroidales bacterium]
MVSYTTLSAKKENITKEWVLIDAENQILGRLATVTARLLRGKHKTNFTPNLDCGDNVVIINAEKIQLTGNKWNARIHFRYTGYPGGQKNITPAQMITKKPTSVVEEAIRGMLPKNRLGRALFRNLHVYAGTDHPHQGQNPKPIDIQSIK